MNQLPGRGDQIDGQAGNDRLYGGSGVDTISGSDGNDIIAGNAGNDALDGRTGNDIVIAAWARILSTATQGAMPWSALNPMVLSSRVLATHRALHHLR